MTRRVDADSWQLINECAGLPYDNVVAKLGNIKEVFCNTQLWELPTREVLDYIHEVASILDVTTIHFAAEGVGLFASSFSKLYGDTYRIVASDSEKFKSSFFEIRQHNVSAIDRWCLGQGTLLVIVWPHHAFHAQLLQGLQMNAYDGFLAIGEISHLGTCLKASFVDDVMKVGMKRAAIANRKSLSFFDHPHCETAKAILGRHMPGDTLTRSVQELFVPIHSKLSLSTDLPLFNRRLGTSNWWAACDVLCSLEEGNVAVLLSNTNLVFDCIRIIIGCHKPPDHNQSSLLEEDELVALQAALRTQMQLHRDELVVLAKLLHCQIKGVLTKKLQKWKYILSLESLQVAATLNKAFADIKALISATESLRDIPICSGCLAPAAKIRKKSALQECKACHCDQYCSVKCQHFHWDIHKACCTAGTSATQTAEPSSSQATLATDDGVSQAGRADDPSDHSDNSTAAIEPKTPGEPDPHAA